MQMKTEYKRIQTQHRELIFRRYQESDISYHADYLFGSPKEFLESIGFDPDFISIFSNLLCED